MHWQAIRAVRTSFGSRPNKYAINEEEDTQIRKSIMDGLIQIDILQDLQLILAWLIGKTFMLRGGGEHHELTWDRFSFGSVTDGNFVGRPTVEFAMGFDKSHQLGITNPTTRTEKTRIFSMHNVNDPLSLYTLMQKYRAMCPPEQTRFYCYPLSQADIEFRTRYGIDYVSNPSRPLGINTIVKFSKVIAKKANLTEWKRFTNHG